MAQINPPKPIGSSLGLVFISLLFYCYTPLFSSFAPFLLKKFPLKNLQKILWFVLIVIYYFLIVFILHLHFITLHHFMHILFPCHLFLLSLFLVCI